MLELGAREITLYQQRTIFTITQLRIKGSRVDAWFVALWLTL
jgi:hypothetical protein